MNPISQTVNIKENANQEQVIFRKLVPDFYSVIWKLQVLLSDIFSIDIIYDHVCCIGNIKFAFINRQLILAGVFPFFACAEFVERCSFLINFLYQLCSFFLINTVPFHYTFDTAVFICVKKNSSCLRIICIDRSWTASDDYGRFLLRKFTYKFKRFFQEKAVNSLLYSIAVSYGDSNPMEKSFELIERTSKKGEKTAQDVYHLAGWVSHHNLDSVR